MPDREPRTTVVVVTWRGRDLVGACLDALAAQTRPHRLLVVDNASTDGTAAVLAGRGVPVVRLRRNAGYAGALAAVLPAIETPYLAWLNDDAEPEPDWLAVLESTLDRRPEVAAAGSVLLGPDGARSAGVRLTPDGHGADAGIDAEPRPGAKPDPGSDPDPGTSTSASTSASASADADADADRGAGSDADGAVFGVCGGAALLRTGVLRAVGGVPAGFFCYYEDTDTSWRLRLAGHGVVTAPAARVRHRLGASTEPGSRRFHRWNERNRLLMLVRCAPAAVAVRELARFAAITAVLPLRRDVPAAPNFTLPLRLSVLAGVAVRLPAAAVARARIGRRSTVPRSQVWQRWTRPTHAAS